MPDFSHLKARHERNFQEAVFIISGVFWYARLPIKFFKGNTKGSNNTQKNRKRLWWHSTSLMRFLESPTIHLALFLLVDETL